MKKYSLDFKMLKAMGEEVGFGVEEKMEGDMTYPGAFVKGTRRIWKIREGWQTADLVDGKYCNHFPMADLVDALMRPLTELERL